MMTTIDEEGPIHSPAADAGTRSIPAALFSVWHRTVSAVAVAPARLVILARTLAGAWFAQWPLVLDYHSESAGPWDVAAEIERRSAAAVGLRAFVFGLIMTGIGVASSTSMWLPIAVGVGSQVLWAGARFIILALLMPAGAISRARLSTAYLAGLLPYALAATWLLQLVALAASALLTGRGLIGAGVPERDARVAIAWAFGGQAAIVVGGWLARALIVLVAG